MGSSGAGVVALCDDAAMASTDAPITFEIEGRLARIVLNRPDQLNALNDDMRVHLRDAFSELEERPDVSVLVLSGAGRAFSAGADLKTTSYAPIEGDWATRRHITGSWQRLIEQLGRLPQATAAVIHGYVVGGASLLAGACDIRIATESTVLRIPELLIGIPLAWAGFPTLAREVGLPAARDWVMTGRPVRADELLRTGFITRVAPDDEFEAAASTLIEELLAAPPGPLAMTRAMSSAIGRANPTLIAGWGDPDHQQWVFGEDEYREAARRYLDGS